MQKPMPAFHAGQAPHLNIGGEQLRLPALLTTKSGNDSPSMGVTSMLPLASKPAPSRPELARRSPEASIPHSTTLNESAGSKDALISRVREMEAKIEEIENQRLEMEKKYVAALADASVKNAKVRWLHVPEFWLCSARPGQASENLDLGLCREQIAEQDRAINSLEERLRSLDVAVKRGAGERRIVDEDEEVVTSALNARVDSLLSRMDMLLKN
mmetsp:Transcript_25638/g.101146  ORF Transcript_25638/g.101146 Transcript_25638/m.101146 type:complete len:214 (-) Transcript_25638:102-743(-)